MENIIAFDVASEVTWVRAIDKQGKLLIDQGVPTTINDLLATINKIPRHRTLVFEEGCQADWLWSELSPFCDDVIVCDPKALKQTGQKSDRLDAQKLADRARVGDLKRVWHGGKELQDLRQMVHLYLSLSKHCTRLKNQIRAVFRSLGVPGGKLAYVPKTRIAAIEKLPSLVSQNRVKHLAQLLDVAVKEHKQVTKVMVALARQRPRYRELLSMDGVGEIFGSFIIAIVGNPERFPSRRQFWSYSGLAITKHETGEYAVQQGKIVHKKRRVQTHGLVRDYNRILKYVFKQVALTLSRNQWNAEFLSLMARSKNGNNVRLTLARKVAAVVLHILKTGEEYDVAKVFKQQ